MDLSNENIIHKKGEKLDYIQFRKLLEYPEITHAITLSTNHFSIFANEEVYKNKETLIKNYKNLAKELQIDYNKIIRPYQTHTDTIKIIEQETKEIEIFPKELENVDGLITNKKNIFFSLGYADCIPILIYDKQKKVIANIHSGWKGTLKKIAPKAVKQMILKYNSKPEDILCFIGPSIRKCHFEVEQDVYEKFEKEIKRDNASLKEEVIIKNIKSSTKYNIDTVQINKDNLKQIGILEENIIDSKMCTVCNHTKIHSYRIEKEKAGRNTAIIGIKT
ncbi:MAG: peptidoglycan editing factor PgeF [Clostridia bacterium]|jgi:YfiH family protein|nr:peptidoglycan editing factor PgeF [Clostridia bacterium]